MLLYNVQKKKKHMPTDRKKWDNYKKRVREGRSDSGGEEDRKDAVREWRVFDGTCEETGGDCWWGVYGDWIEISCITDIEFCARGQKTNQGYKTDEKTPGSHIEIQAFLF